ncbi:ATP-binding cassette domain-containing protein [Parvimonas parva]|uniref:ATP-binding cassette domain-containing protein n=1 Tax=Parvimonas parva TaxID=2769485 RepID=UPI0038CD6D04
MCTLLGPSSSGKSTLLNIVSGIETFEKGSITINGEVMENMSEKKILITEESI